MSLNSQQYANLAEHTYDRKGELRSLVHKQISLEGVNYKVLEYVDKASGYQGAIYQRVDTGDIVVAHRGSEFGREPFKDGLLADGGMVASRVNRQAGDAIELTRRALDMAEREGRRNGHTPEVTVTGHSLGGTLAQISAHYFDLRGETFNAYGAVSLGYRIPQGGSRLLNHVMAGDPVSAASAHYGQVHVYAQPGEIAVLTASGHLNTPLPVDKPFRQSMAAAVALGVAGSHNMDNFINVDGHGRPDVSVLGDPLAQTRAYKYDPMIDKYRGDVQAIRRATTLTAGGPIGNFKDMVDGVRGDLEPGEPARREIEIRAGRYGAYAPAQAAPNPPDDPMLARFRESLPAGVSQEKLVQLVLQTKQQTGITDPDRIASIQAHGDHVFVLGTAAGYRAKLDLSEPAPPLQQTLQQSHKFDLQQAQERQQEQTRQQQLRQ